MLQSNDFILYYMYLFYLMMIFLFLHQRSPDLSSSRDDDDSGYNSIKADEVIYISYVFFVLF